jgi:hypothetical protein
MFLEIKDSKGKIVSRCEVSKDGSFSCPALPAGDYTASLEWSWGASNQAGSTGSSASPAGRSPESQPRAGRISYEPLTITFGYSVKSPRDAASGQASGKRQHKPFTFVKEIDKSSPTLMKTMDKSTPKLMLATFTIDDDCDGITGSIKGSDGKKHIDIESWSWGASQTTR